MTVDQDQPTPARRVPGKRWYLIAGLLALAGLVAAGLSLWLTLTRIGDDFQRATFPGQAELTLPESGTYTIFVERAAGSSLDPAVGNLFVEVFSPQGQSLELSNPGGSLTYTFGGQTGEAVLQFDADEGGAFLMVGDYRSGDGPPVTLAVSKGFGGRLFAGIGAVILIPLLTWLAAIVIVIVTFLKRRKTAAKSSTPQAV